MNSCEKLNLRVVPEYYSSGIWIIKKPFQSSYGVNTNYEYLNLPQGLKDDFESWQDSFDRNNPHRQDEYWDEGKFNQEGLSLARRLKSFLKNSARVEYSGDIFAEIRLFYVDYNVDKYKTSAISCEDGDRVNLDDLFRQFSIKYNSVLDRKFQEWLKIDISNFTQYELMEFDRMGKELTDDLATILPKECVVEYKKLSKFNENTELLISDILNGKMSIIQWVKENIQDGKLCIDRQYEMPDKKDYYLSKPELRDINFIPGALEAIYGGWNSEEGKAVAAKIIDMISDIHEVYKKEDLCDNDTLEIKLANLYTFLLTQSACVYGYDFVEMISRDDELYSTALRVGVFFMKRAVHKEPIKFGICATWYCGSEEIDDLLFTLGLADDFSIYTTCSFEMKQKNDNVFKMAKLTDGYGRLNYLKGLDATNDEIKTWMIYHGYKCSLGCEFTAYICASRGDLLSHIKKGWNDDLYDCAGDIVCGLIDDHEDRIFEYTDAKEVVELFLKESLRQNMNIDRFNKLCDIFYFIRDNWEQIGWGEEEKDKLVDQISDIAYNKNYNWEEQVRKNVFDHKARNIAKALNINIWNDLFNYAIQNDNFSDWYSLAQTDNIAEFRMVCMLAEKLLDLKNISAGIGDELGFNGNFGKHSDLSIILQKMREFNQIVSIDLVQAGLNCPVTNTRNAALRVVASCYDVPKKIIQTITRNRDTEPNKGSMEYYNSILNISKCKCCDNYIKINTVYDMLKRVKDYVESDKKIAKLLGDLMLDADEVGIMQECSRLQNLVKNSNNECYEKKYRCIRFSDSGIYLKFNENFTSLLSIELSIKELFEKDMFLNFKSNDVKRGYYTKFKNMTYDSRVEFVQNALGNYDENLRNAYFEVIQLGKQDKNGYAEYPKNNHDGCPYFIYNTLNSTNKANIELVVNEEWGYIDEPISGWLHQFIVNMYPDYGDTYLWNEGSASGIYCFKKYDLEGTLLDKELNDWEHDFMLNSENFNDLDWDRFNSRGKVLHKNLQAIVKNDYIVVYAMSFEEQYGSFDG